MQTILFLCPHGAAKSVLAATDFQRLADQRGLAWQANWAGTEPDEKVHPAVQQVLEAEGFSQPWPAPRSVTLADLRTATRIVSLGCDLRNRLPPESVVEHWDDVPPVSQNLPAARAVIRAHLEKLLDELAH